MKKQNKKTTLQPNEPKINVKKLIKFCLTCLWLSIFLYVFADDIQILISRQTATWVGSNNSQVTFSHTWGWYQTYYVEEGGNSAIIWNYLKGYYYNSGMWFFQLDWSGSKSKNVSIVSSTEKCGTSYGYKLWGNAYSEFYWFMDFDYDDDIFVYYCEWDKKLHWFWYSTYAWFQNFDGIGFEILPWTWALLWTTSSNLFVNDTTDINKKNTYTGSDSNYNNNWIGWEIFNIDDTKESVIYIIR